MLPLYRSTSSSTTPTPSSSNRRRRPGFDGLDGDDAKGFKKSLTAKAQRFVVSNWRGIALVALVLVTWRLVSAQGSQAEKGSKPLPKAKVVELPKAVDPAAPLPDTRAAPVAPASLVSNFPVITAEQRKQVWDSRAKAVQRAFSHAWDGYVQYAWNHDELKPNSQRGESWLNMGLTILDALDTAWVLGNKTIFNKAKDWVLIEKGLTMDADVNANVFETTIRVIGGLLSSFHLSKDGGFLKEAVRVADKFMPAFTESKSGIPFNSIHLKSGQATNPGETYSSTAEATTIQLEFKYLSHLTNDPKYWNAAQKVSQVLYESPSDKTAPWDNLVPVYLDHKHGSFVGSEIRLGSHRTLLPCQYRKALHNGIKKHLLMRSNPSNLLYIREHSGNFGENGGLFGKDMEELYFAEELARSCWEMYRQTASDPVTVSKQIVKNSKRFHQFDLGTHSARVNDVPVALETVKDVADGEVEAIETFFILYRVTGDEKYREWGWRMFRSFEQWSKVATGGYTSLNNVQRASTTVSRQDGVFLLGRDFEVFLSAFSDDDLLPLDQYVFNTECHPLPIFEKVQWMKDVKDEGKP
ncbi:hypothetical protein BCR33DRAFT_715563 [Rhizoclosmatium globosum]|uniref:alpha-1,2-Mannosidase n=1 Tax=Rhizoclosmatium globosum TaxID=329046 RepID=A0A1Y2CHI0_9FUNG|nr:hypothetical protein BCR33DRAFT_715563 [Rhizoclosmatium globosum]|eukprot:ORY46498.1 hypothetical protein BCR33DRAFT_715563 [Rhizoclosmatium globosum]